MPRRVGRTVDLGRSFVGEPPGNCSPRYDRSGSAQPRLRWRHRRPSASKAGPCTIEVATCRISCTGSGGLAPAAGVEMRPHPLSTPAAGASTSRLGERRVGGAGHTASQNSAARSDRPLRRHPQHDRPTHDDSRSGQPSPRRACLSVPPVTVSSRSRTRAAGVERARVDSCPVAAAERRAHRFRTVWMATGPDRGRPSGDGSGRTPGVQQLA